MDNKGWPEMDELGNIKGIKISMFDKITEKDNINIVASKQQKQLKTYERMVRRECTT